MWFSKLKRPPRAVLYATPKFLNFKTVSGIDMSIVDPKGQNIVLPPDADAAVIGESLTACLKASRSPRRGRDPDLYHYREIEKRYKVWRSDLMERHNYKTQKSMFSVMQLINFEEAGNHVRGEKMKLENLHKQGWTRSKTDPVLNIHSDLSSHEIGTKILDFLAAHTRL